MFLSENQKKITYINKSELVKHLHEILDNDLDEILQGNYTKRNMIMSKFEAIINDIEKYK